MRYKASALTNRLPCSMVECVMSRGGKASDMKKCVAVAGYIVSIVISIIAVIISVIVVVFIVWKVESCPGHVCLHSIFECGTYNQLTVCCVLCTSEQEHLLIHSEQD